MRVDVYDAQGSATDTVELDPALFEAPVNVPVLHQVVTAQLAAARAGTAKTKSRGEVRGGGAKPWRQKGTGRARQGSIRSPQWAGGGVAHGPTGEQNHRKRVNKKVRRLALASALSDRAGSGDVRVIRDFGLSEPRTRDAVALLDRLELAGRSVLIVLAERDDVVARSFRNLPYTHVLTAGQLNVHDLLTHDVVVFAEAALDSIGGGRRSAANDAAVASADTDDRGTDVADAATDAEATTDAEHADTDGDGDEDEEGQQ
ncbi:MAG TPA: 50S ribosomal protein L4 [Euzebyales bacterium]